MNSKTMIDPKGWAMKSLKNFLREQRAYYALRSRAFSTIKRGTNLFGGGDYMSGKTRRLYRLYNIEAGGYGLPFAMCDFHYKDWTPPVTCIVEKVADGALWPCNKCGDEPDIEELCVQLLTGLEKEK